MMRDEIVFWFCLAVELKAVGRERELVVYFGSLVLEEKRITSP
jgi:hypothetical protein